MAQAITQVYRQFDPAKPLSPGDSRYVPCEGVRGIRDLVTPITNAIRQSSEDEPVHLLFTGHRGCGKTTELLRVAERLADPAAGADRSFVVYFEADHEDIDVNDVDFPDLLLAIIRHIGQDLRERAGIELRPPAGLRLIVDSLQEFLHLLGGVQLDKLEFDAKIAKVTATVKSSPDVRGEIRKALEPNVSNLILGSI